MSSIFAFAKSRLSPVGSANSAGKALPARAPDPILLRRYSYSQGLRPAGLVAHLGEVGKSSSAVEFLFLPSELRQPFNTHRGGCRGAV
jgi:hypothetical protein